MDNKTRKQICLILRFRNPGPSTPRGMFRPKSAGIRILASTRRWSSRLLPLTAKMMPCSLISGTRTQRLPMASQSSALSNSTANLPAKRACVPTKKPAGSHWRYMKMNCPSSSMSVPAISRRAWRLTQTAGTTRLAYGTAKKPSFTSMASWQRARKPLANTTYPPAMLIPSP